ncbi:MAG: ATP-binding protein [Syntrophobacteraceae bacterium]
MVLKYPSRIVVATSNRVLSYSQLARQSPAEEIIFDLSNTDFLTPFGIVLLAGTISECLSQNKKVKYRQPQNEETNNFLSGIGFYEFFRLPDKKQKIESSHVQLRRLASIDYLLTQQIVQVFDYAITMSAGLQGSLTMAINEIMTNTFDHSGSEKGCYVCAQAYENLIRLCVADFGVGLYAKLFPKYSDAIQDCYGAIKLATKKGITTRTKQDGGLGLWHIKRLIKVNNGQMSILSGDGKAVWDFRGSRIKVRKQTMSLPFSGTIINLEINKDKETLYFLIDQEGQIF